MAGGKVREVDCSQMLKGSCLPLPLIEIFLKKSDSTGFMVFKGTSTWARQVSEQMMIPARNHWAAQSRNSGNRGTSLFEVGEVVLIVEYCLPGTAEWRGRRYSWMGERG